MLVAGVNRGHLIMHKKENSIYSIAFLLTALAHKFGSDTNQSINENQILKINLGNLTTQLSVTALP